MQHQAASASLQFSESPMSPLRRARAKASHSPLHKPDTTVRKCEFAGSLKAVNEHLSKEGLLRQTQIQPLISETSLEPKTPEIVRKFRKERIGNEEEVEDAALIERYSYPGYMTDRVTPLPHQLDALQLMEKVTQVQGTLKTKYSFLCYWRELFLGVTSHNIFLDVFWWFFLNRYQPRRDKQDLLFDRIAENYTNLLTKVSLKYSDSFFKMYPDVLAQCIYSAFIHSFPTSWNSFDEQFKTALCSLIYQWFLGIKPLPDIWRQWNTKELEPKNLMRHIPSKESKSPTKKFDLDCLISTVKQQTEGHTPTSDTLLPTIVVSNESSSDNITGRESEIVKISKSKSKHPIHGERGEPEKQEEPQTIGGPEFEHVVMDTSSHSPLVEHFLSTHGLTCQTGHSILLQHADITRQADPDSALTYQQVLKQSATKSQHTKKAFERSYKSLKDHLHKCEQERINAARKHTRELSCLMSNTRELKTLSNFLTVNQLCDQSEKKRKEKAEVAITNAMKRVS